MCSVPASCCLYRARDRYIALHRRSYAAETSEITPDRGVLGDLEHLSVNRLYAKIYLI